MDSAAGTERAIPRRASYGRSAGQIFKRDFFLNQRLSAWLDAAMRQHVRAGLRVLDFGCGEQPFRRQMEAAGATYYSMDVVQNAGGTVDFVGRLETFAPRAPQFDVILCSEVLEHTENPGQIVEILASLLRVDGVMIVTTPFVHGLHEEPHDYCRLTPHFFRHAAKENRLTVVSGEKLGSSLECAITAFGFFLYSVAPQHVFWKPVRVVAMGVANQLGRMLGAMPAFRANPLMYLSNAWVMKKAEAG